VLRNNVAQEIIRSFVNNTYGIGSLKYFAFTWSKKLLRIHMNFFRYILKKNITVPYIVHYGTVLYIVQKH